MNRPNPVHNPVRSAAWQPGPRILAPIVALLIALTVLWAPEAAHDDATTAPRASASPAARSVVASAPAKPAAPVATVVPAVLTRKVDSLVGRWDVEVTIHTDPVQYASLFCDFRADHSLTCVNKPDYPALTGVGVWRAEKSRVAFWITHHAHVDDDGNPVGSINAVHLGTLRKDGFTTDATTFVALDDGSPWIGPISVDSVGQRLSAD